MKVMSRFLASSLLTLALSVSVFAGQIETGLTPYPSPTPDTVTTTSDDAASVAGQIETGIAGEISTTAPTSDLMVETTLGLVRSVLALF